MPSISLAAFSIRIRRRNDRHRCTLSEFNGEHDAFDILNRYLSQGRLNTDIDRLKKSYHLSELIADQRTLSGIIKCGSYGYESDIVEKDTGAEVHHRETEEAELLPFYFQIYVPVGENEGIVLLQKFGAFGLTSIFRHMVIGRFNGAFRNYKLELSPLIPEALLEDYFGSGRIAKLRLIRFTLPADIADSLQHAHHEDECEVELSIKAKRGNSLAIRERLLDVFRGTRPATRILELESFDYVTSKVELEIDGKSKTIDMADFAKMRPTFDITNTVEYGDDGHPTYESIANEGNEIMEMFRNALEI